MKIEPKKGENEIFTLKIKTNIGRTSGDEQQIHRQCSKWKWQQKRAQKCTNLFLSFFLSVIQLQIARRFDARKLPNSEK